MRYDKAFRESGYLSAVLTSFEFDPIVFENVALAGLTTGGTRDVSFFGLGPSLVVGSTRAGQGEIIMG